MSIHSSGIPRRAVVRGAAWTAPTVMLATSAPAYASTSLCVPLSGLRIDWASADYVRHNSLQGTYIHRDPAAPGGEPLLSLDISYKPGSNIKAGDQSGAVQLNLAASDGSVGGLGDSGLTIQQSPVIDIDKVEGPTPENSSVTTFNFGRVIDTLSFTICGIDTSPGCWDYVGFVPAPATYSIARPDLVIGRGVHVDDPKYNPFFPGDEFTAAQDSNSGNVSVTLKSFTSFNLYFWNASGDETGTVDQRIYLSDFVVDAVC